MLPVKKKEINSYYFTYFYMLYDFINCPAFADIFLHSFAGQNFVVVVLEKFFFSFGSQKKWSLVVLKSNNMTRICLGRLSIGHFTEVFI